MRIPVNQLRPGDIVDQVFIVRDRQFNTTKAGQPFAKVELGDCTGKIGGIYWDVPPAAMSVLEATKYVTVRASVTTYQNALQLKLDTLGAAPPESVNVEDFLPTTSHDIPEMFKELKRILAQVTNPWLVELVRAIFTDKDICDRLKRAPAASAMHHAYIGGLLEHTTSMAQVAMRVCEHYTWINRDLLLVGVLIHDLGKIHEFDYEDSIGYSDAGRLVGHIGIGISIVENKAREIEGFPQALLDVLRHYILSHHGVPEFGAIRQPMTGEAIALHYIDNLDAKLAAFFKATTEHPVASDNWTAYQKMFETYLYRGNVLAPEDAESAAAGEESGDGADLFR